LLWTAHRRSIGLDARAIDDLLPLGDLVAHGLIHFPGAAADGVNALRQQARLMPSLIRLSDVLS
jgi:hypothetical protein